MWYKFKGFRRKNKIENHEKFHQIPFFIVLNFVAVIKKMAAPP